MGGKRSSVHFAFMKWEKGFGVKLVPSYVLSGPGQRFIGNGFLLILVCSSRGSFSTVPSVIVSSFHEHQQMYGVTWVFPSFPCVPSGGFKPDGQF